MHRAPLVLALAAAFGCTETIQIAHDPLAELAAIELVPADAQITLTELGPPHHMLQYRAMGRFANGEVRDITSLVTWSLDNTLLGAIEPDGVFVASHAAAGHAVVTASARELAARGTLAVLMNVTVVDAAFPPPAADLFDPDTPVIDGDPDEAPQLVYPSDGTVFPQRIASTLFQYTTGATNDAFRLRFDSDVLHLVVETGTDRWQASGVLQRVLAGSGLAGPLRVQVQATSSTGPGTIYAGTPITLAYSADHPGGPLYFWSAATNGIMRGGIGDSAASKLYPSDGTCVGCHALSRDGRALAMGFDNGLSFDLQAIELDTLATTIAASTQRPMGWATYSPDGTRLLVANNGILTLYDATSGASLGTVPLPAMRYATHPDWSPDGKHVAIALTNQTPNNLDVKAASIARIAYNDGAWGAPVVIVPGTPTNNNFFPRWSPDGKLLAYVNAAGSSQGAASAELRIVDFGGGTPRALASANRRVGAGELSNLATTMPAWAPHVGERAWLAFVSTRPYGLLAPGQGQIWITSLDLTSTTDPSSPAFWLPCQDVTVLNYAPVWASEVVTR